MRTVCVLHWGGRGERQVPGWPLSLRERRFTRYSETARRGTGGCWCRSVRDVRSCRASAVSFRVDNEDWDGIREIFWGSRKGRFDPGFLLADFACFAEFLAQTHVERIRTVSREDEATLSVQTAQDNGDDVTRD